MVQRAISKEIRKLLAPPRFALRLARPAISFASCDTLLITVMTKPLPRNSSVVGRLLEELSWVGATIRNYRNGGRGYENVLTAEALQALDFLPRGAFLGAVLDVAHGADTARAKLISEIEEAKFTLLP
jgi:hypothetical protein